jgi:secretion/DNA translocation related TadE-like protein
VTVLAAVTTVLLLSVTALVVQLGAATLARQRAEIGADLAALAAAARVLRGPDHACARAVAVATANGSRLVDCKVRGVDAYVTVTAEVSAGPMSGVAVGKARAGPVRPMAGDDTGP